MDDKKELFIKQFNNINNKCFVINDRILYITIENDSLISGGCCNTGIFKEYEKPIDYDLTVDQNLEALYNYIIESMVV